MTETRVSTWADKRQDALKRLEDGYKRARDSERFREWLRVAARFHRYSAHNTMLIWTQRPDATRVAGFQTWRKLGRCVRSGEKGIMILAPQTYKRTETSNEGEEEEVQAIYFKPVHVFDVSQTDGADLPEPVDLLQGDDAGLWDRLAGIGIGQGLAIDRTAGRHPTANGFYARTRREVWVSPDLPPAQSAKTLAHELAHHFADHQTNTHCEGEAETIAEAAAYVVLAHCGIDSGAYSFGYLATWTDDKTFREKLGEIQRTASRIITALEEGESA